MSSLLIPSSSSFNIVPSFFPSPPPLSISTYAYIRSSFTSVDQPDFFLDLDKPIRCFEIANLLHRESSISKINLRIHSADLSNSNLPSHRTTLETLKSCPLPPSKFPPSKIELVDFSASISIGRGSKDGDAGGGGGGCVWRLECLVAIRRDTRWTAVATTTGRFVSRISILDNNKNNNTTKTTTTTTTTTLNLSFLPLASPITRQILLVPFFFRGVVGAERRMRPWRRTMHRPPYRPLRGVLGRLIGGRIYHRALALWSLVYACLTRSWFLKTNRHNTCVYINRRLLWSC